MGAPLVVGAGGRAAVVITAVTEPLDDVSIAKLRERFERELGALAADFEPMGNGAIDRVYAAMRSGRQLDFGVLAKRVSSELGPPARCVVAWGRATPRATGNVVSAHR